MMNYAEQKFFIEKKVKFCSYDARIIFFDLFLKEHQSIYGRKNINGYINCETQELVADHIETAYFFRFWLAESEKGEKYTVPYYNLAADIEQLLVSLGDYIVDKEDLVFKLINNGEIKRYIAERYDSSATYNYIKIHLPDLLKLIKNKTTE